MTKPGPDRCRIPGTKRLAAAAAFLLMLVAAEFAPAQTFNVLHNFNGLDGRQPYAGVTVDGGGNLYGTAYDGGTGAGTVYKLTHHGSGWTLDVLSSFAGGGANPYAGVIFGPNGTLYGTTSKSSADGGNGTVFNLSPLPSVCKTSLCDWSEDVLYGFTGAPHDGYGPGPGDVSFDQAGNIYGVTYSGGNGYGVVYQLTPAGGSWTENVLHLFAYGDGAYPYSRMILDNAGNVYGTTWGGGATADGTVFELTPSGSGWTSTVLYSFQSASDGGNPYAGVIFDSSGNLYGATSSGGTGGGGTVFKLTPSNGSWTYSVIYSFAGTNDCGPQNSLVMDAAGNLYGTTYCDGADSLGNVFKLTASGEGWSYTSLHDFSGGNDGEIPFCSVAFDSSGNIYGTTVTGGTQGVGTIWEITP